MKLAISDLLTKFFCYLCIKYIICKLIIIRCSKFFFFICDIFAPYPASLTKVLNLDIWFLTAKRAVKVDKPEILGILLLTSLTLALRPTLIAKLVISVILSLILLLFQF